MTQTTLIDEGCFTYQDRVAVNNNFTELYGNRSVETGAATLSASGASTLDSAVATTFVLPAPVAGVTKYLDCVAATANITVSTTAAAATIGIAGTSLTHIVFTAANQSCTLFAETTAKWIRVATNSSLVTTTT